MVFAVGMSYEYIYIYIYSFTPSGFVLHLFKAQETLLKAAQGTVPIVTWENQDDGTHCHNCAQGQLASTGWMHQVLEKLQFLTGPPLVWDGANFPDSGLLDDL